MTKCDRYYKVWQFYYKVRQVLQSATIITKCDSTYAGVYGSFVFWVARDVIIFLSKPKELPKLISSSGIRGGTFIPIKIFSAL